uniref:Uncharacterized protein n=1 Tax=Anopheles minimus TaxID=112268 RepID=A0A182WN94_9DIPT
MIFKTCSSSHHQHTHLQFHNSQSAWLNN